MRSLKMFPLLVFSILVAMLLPTAAKATQYGCEWGRIFDPVPNNIEYYIQQDVSDNGLGSMSGSQAVWSIRSAIDKISRESGALITFKYMGLTSTLDCTLSTSVSTYSNPTMIVRRTTTCDYCSDNESPACANSYFKSYEINDPDYTVMKCGYIQFVDNEASCPQNAWGAYGDSDPVSEDDIIMGTIHEAMHVLRFDHVNNCPETIDDESVMHSYISARRSLSRADRRYLRSHYGFKNSEINYSYDNEFGPDS